MLTIALSSQKGMTTPVLIAAGQTSSDEKHYQFVGSRINTSDVSFENLSPTGLTTDEYAELHYNLKLTMKSEDDNPMHGVFVRINRNDGSPAEMTTYSGSTVLCVLTGSTITDASGVVDVYLKSSTITLNGMNTSHPVSTDTIVTPAYPYTIVSSKEGYQYHEIILNRFDDALEQTTVLKRTEPVHVSSLSGIKAGFDKPSVRTAVRRSLAKK
ncbi:MAG TPA: hypothetical protein VK179_19580 [Bacteroidales bacterium]|nr:hypothetical protein [Bacteroidales bacterium]